MDLGDDNKAWFLDITPILSSLKNRVLEEINCSQSVRRHLRSSQSNFILIINILCDIY
jgi:hypothetical protein